LRFLLREADGRGRVELDRHTVACFSREEWLAWFEEAGLTPRIHRDRWKRDVFIGKRRRS
jgi:hypothetical protein